MVFIGIDERTRATESGIFHCPHCGPNREYHRLCRGQYATAFFIPVVQLAKLTERIACTNCCTQFETSVLRRDPELERQERADRIKLIMILTLRDSGISDAALRCIQNAFRDECGEELLREDIERDIAASREAETDPLLDIIRVSQKLQPNGASTALRSAFLAATADGKLRDDQNASLQELGEALGLSESAILRIIGSAD